MFGIWYGICGSLPGVPLIVRLPPKNNGVVPTLFKFPSGSLSTVLNLAKDEVTLFRQNSNKKENFKKLDKSNLILTFDSVFWGTS